MEKKLNLGILSTAMINSKYYPAFTKNDSINIVGIASRTREKA